MALDTQASRLPISGRRAAGAYFMLTFRVVIDSTMVVNVLQTDQRAAFALINVRMIGVLAVLAGLPCWLLWRTDVAFARWPVQGLRNLGLVLAALGLAIAVAFASFQPLASVMRNHAQLRYLINPLNTVYALGHVVSKPLRRNQSKLEPVSLDAKLGKAGHVPFAGSGRRRNRSERQFRFKWCLAPHHAYTFPRKCHQLR